MSIDNVIPLLNVSQDLWSSVLACLRANLSSAIVEMWFGNLHLEKVEGDCAKLVATNDLVVSWINGHFKDALLSAFQKVSEDITRYEISVPEKTKPAPVLSLSSPSQRASVVRRPKITSEARENAATLASFYPTYSFDTFVKGDSNQIALAMCRTIAENPQECSMNPFFLFGETGVGKTHLLQSIGRYAIVYGTASRIVYRTSESFLKDFMKTQLAASAGERSDAAQNLRHTYEEPQLLLIDDIQILAGKGKGATEKALFDVLQKRVAAKRQTVFCADRRPSEIPNLYGGFTHFDANSVSVDVPDLLTRMNILRRKAEKLQIPAEERERIFSWVAKHQRGNVREIEGVVTKLFAYHDLLGVNLTLETFQALCESCNVTSPAEIADRPLPTVQSVKEVVALAYHVSTEALRACSRVKSVSEPRKVAMYLCRALTKESLSNIGFHFGRDYSTVIANIKSVEREMRKDPDFAQKVENLKESFSI